MNNIHSEKIYLGPRDASFKALITNLLTRGKLKPKYIELLTSEENMKQYDVAFTAASANDKENYEVYEQIGDLAANKFIVGYSYRRFPQLYCPLGVKIVARLRINYGSKKSFSNIAMNLGFWDYITCAEEGIRKGVKYRNKNREDLLEDCLESFLGCTEYLLDKSYTIGVGYAIVYDIMKSIFDDIDISLKYTDLYDAKTRLKELIDTFQSELGTVVYINTREGLTVESVIYRVPPGVSSKIIKSGDMRLPNPSWLPIATGNASKQDKAEQMASERALKILNDTGWVKKIPDEYHLFCK
jgi:dsRNA-specific ribonuclease